MKTKLSIFPGMVILLLLLACGSSEQEVSPTTAQVADVSQFPTPTRSQAEPQPTSPPAVAQVQTSQDAGGSTDEQAPMTEEEIQDLRQRLQSGELSEEEAQQAFQRLRSQFGDGPGGPGGPGGSQVAGSIESLEESSLTVATDLASVSVDVGADTIIRITSVLEATALTDDTQVLVVSERMEGKTLARVITIIPEGQTGFRGGGLGRLGGGQGTPGGGQGGFGANQAAPGGGQGGFGGNRGLFGTVTGVSDTGFTLETQQGPLPIAIDEDSVILETREGAFTDLEVGMQVRIAGPAAENGTIEARSVIVTPEGLEDTRPTNTGL